MRDPCVDEQELAELLASAEDHPRRKHLDECSRCRARLAAFRAFMDEARVPPGANPAEAAARLDEFRRREILGKVLDRPGRGRESEKSPFARFLSWHWAAPVAAAALVIAIIGAWQLLENRGPAGPEKMLLRGEKSGSSALAPLVAESAGGGAVTLSWTTLPEADAYEVTVLGSDLSELRTYPVGQGTSARCSWTLPSDEIALLHQGPGGLFWSVRALRQGDEIARSDPRLLPTEGRE
jgi:hypothetical protein